MRRRLFVLVALVIGTAVLWPAAAPAMGDAKPPRIARYSVFEHSVSWRSQSGNPWDQVEVSVQLVSPRGGRVRIGGFYFKPGVWKFRFAPSVVGRWTWTARIQEGSRSGTYRGSFDVIRGHSHGFVRQSPYNRQRWTFSDGTPYYPIGLNDCTNVNNEPAKLWGLDGGVRTGPGHQPGRLVGIQTYMRAYSAAGFDLFRWGPDNCSFPLYDRIDPAGNVYSQSGAAAADTLFRTLRQYGFRIEMVLFGDAPPFASGSDASDPAKLAAVERYARYVVDRWGAYVDFWELTNEASPSDAWLTAIGKTVHGADPYGHPLGTSWSRPQLSVMQFGSDHWYQSEDSRESDTLTWTRLRSESARALGKPTLVDEQGNTGQNWDPTSGLRLRLRSWTAFFAEGTLVFWNTSFIKNCCPNGTSSVYIGPEERSYVRVLQSYTAGFDPRAKIVSAEAAPSSSVRAYALRGPKMYGLYMVATDPSRPTSGVRVTVDPERGGTATWIDPASGRVLARTKVKAGKSTLAAPPFTVDVALKIT